MRPSDVSRDDVERYVEVRSATPSAARQELHLLSPMFRTAAKWRVTRLNPCDGVERPGFWPRTRYATDDELALVHAIAPEVMKIAVALALLTGQRHGDLLARTRGHIPDDGIQFTQGKTGKRLVIEWSDERRAVVARATALPPQVPDRWVVRTRDRKRCSGNGFRSNWQRLMLTAVPEKDRRSTVHDLRATCASDTHDLHEATARLSHADPGMTNACLPAWVRARQAASSEKILDRSGDIGLAERSARSKSLKSGGPCRT
jgi:integrase